MGIKRTFISLIVNYEMQIIGSDSQKFHFCVLLTALISGEESLFLSAGGHQAAQAERGLHAYNRAL